MVSPVSATCADPNNAPVPIASGRLTFEDGTCCDIEGKLVSTNTQCRSSSPIHELTYQFDGFAYEIKNCVKGSFTDATNPSELADYLENLKSEIDNVVNQLREM